MSKQIRFKRATAARWLEINPVLLKGEPGIEQEPGQVESKMKVGDGVTSWSGLPYLTGSGGTGESIQIPTLKLAYGHFRAAGTPPKRSEDLYASWDAADESFLAHNPEIWVFRQRNNFRRKLVSETLGVNICTDPGCDDPGAWERSGDVVIEGSHMMFIDTGEGDSMTHLMATSVAVPYAWFEITFTVSGYVSGAIRVFYGNGVTPAISANGTYTYRIRRTSPSVASQADLTFAAEQAGTTLRVDNIFFQRVIRAFDLSHKKKWAHEPHLNGVKYPGSKFYAGETVCKVEAIATPGRQTEFELTSARGEKQLIGLDPYEYFYAQHLKTNEYFKLSDATDTAIIKQIEAAGRKTLSIGFRFAIVIDHPLVEGAKLIGDLSDIVYLRAKTALSTPMGMVSLLLRYRSNAIILR